jgi:hypothetical protein
VIHYHLYPCPSGRCCTDDGFWRTVRRWPCIIATAEESLDQELPPSWPSISSTGWDDDRTTWIARLFSLIWRRPSLPCLNLGGKLPHCWPANNSVHELAIILSLLFQKKKRRNWTASWCCLTACATLTRLLDRSSGQKQCSSVSLPCRTC